MKITKLLYQQIIASDLSDDNLRSREIILNWLLFSLFCLAGAAFISSFITLVFLDLVYVWPRLIDITIFMGLLVTFHNLVHGRHSHRLVSAIVLLMLFGASVAAINALSGLKHAKVRGYIQSDLSWMSGGPSNISDVVLFSGIYSILGLTCWLFNRQMKTFLSRATQAEKALQKQNVGLEEKVLERTRELEKEQLERTQSMYRFAELGHVSTALFHDLANHLSTVSLDIENLHKNTQPEILQRIDDNIHYIDTIVQRVRSQLRGKLKIEVFDIRDEIREVAKVSGLSSQALGVTIKLNFEGDQPVMFEGDTLRFRQIVINLLSNAAESYYNTKIPNKKRVVTVTVKSDRKNASIEIADRGPGIPLAIRECIFDPFYTSKQEGVGIGLFIVRQVVDRDLKGEVELVTTGPRGTTFMVKVPLVRQ